MRSLIRDAARKTRSSPNYKHPSTIMTTTITTTTTTFDRATLPAPPRARAPTKRRNEPRASNVQLTAAVAAAAGHDD